MFPGCDYTIAVQVPKKVTEEQMLQEFADFFDLYFTAHQPLIGSAGSYTELEEYEKVLEYYAENTNYIATEITKKEFKTFEKYDRYKI